MANIWPRLRTAALLALLTGLWCWGMIAGYVIWKFGWIEGYLATGKIPFNPTIPITYVTLFLFNLRAFSVAFIAAFALTVFAPRRWSLVQLCLAWGMGSFAAAVDMSYLFLDHGGGTWLPAEALRATFYHPIVTPFWIILGLVGTASLTRPLRKS